MLGINVLFHHYITQSVCSLLLTKEAHTVAWYSKLNKSAYGHVATLGARNCDYMLNLLVRIVIEEVIYWRRLKTHYLKKHMEGNPAILTQPEASTFTTSNTDFLCTAMCDTNSFTLSLSSHPSSKSQPNNIMAVEMARDLGLLQKSSHYWSTDENSSFLSSSLLLHFNCTLTQSDPSIASFSRWERSIKR